MHTKTGHSGSNAAKLAQM